MHYSLGEFREAPAPVMMIEQFRGRTAGGERPERVMRPFRRSSRRAADLLEEPLLAEEDRVSAEAVHDWMRARRGGATSARLDFCDYRSGPGGWLGLAVTDHSQVARVRAGDEIVAGYGVLRGADGGLRVWPRLFRVVCANGAIIASGTGEAVFCDETTVRHAIDSVLTPDVLARSVSVFRRAALTPLHDPLDLLRRARARTPADAVLHRWTRDGGPTVWGLVNAVTANARTVEKAPKRFELERDAGRILECALARAPGEFVPV